MLVIEGAQVIKCRSVLCTCYVAGRERKIHAYIQLMFIYLHFFLKKCEFQGAPRHGLHDEE
jgi:hypothetical protein